MPTTHIMVPMSEKRHRLYPHEIPEVVKGLRLRLAQLLEEKQDAESAEIALRTLHRLTRKATGRPKYDPFSWLAVSYRLAMFEPD
jgi:hypothetical protein